MTRTELIEAAHVRSMVARKHLYGMDGDGGVYEITFATRNSKLYRKGQLKVSDTCVAVSVEGDAVWTRIPKVAAAAEKEPEPVPSASLF